MRPTEDFTAKNLLEMRTVALRRAHRTGGLDTEQGWRALAVRAEEGIATGTFVFSGISRFSASGRTVLKCTDPSQVLVLRKLADNIRRSYGISQCSRSFAVSLAKTALAEWSPKGVLRLDLKSCFESIRLDTVISQLQKDAVISPQSVLLLRKLALVTRKYTRGIPRGLSVSSVLADYFLRHLDNAVRHEAGVYTYVRYVDDMLVLLACDPKEKLERIRVIASERGLRLNDKKTMMTCSECPCYFRCSHSPDPCPCQSGQRCKCSNGADGRWITIDFLGYHLVSPQRSAGGQPRCYALLSQRKAQRIRSRIDSAIFDLRRRGDVRLFDDRIRFLTGNSAIDSRGRGGRLLVGLAFTHDQYEAPSSGVGYEYLTIQSLDVYLRTRLRLLRKRGVVTPAVYASLIKYSFCNGFTNKRRNLFSSTEMNRIARCW